MTIDDNGEFRRRLLMLAELFDAKFSPAKQALYFEALRDIPFPAVAQALNAAAKACTFMPRPAELRTLALGDGEDQAEGAWMALKLAMRGAGGYSSLVTDDPALGEAILGVFGSWPEACALDLSPEMWSSKRKEFGRVYRVLKGRGLTGARYLTGIHEVQNSRRLDWARFTPVARLEGDRLRSLTAAEADAHRAQIAAQAGFERLQPASVLSLVKRHEDTA